MHPYTMLANLRTRLVVCGAGGFLGGHLVRHLLKMGYRHVRAVDLKPVEDWIQSFDEAENLQLDLRDRGACKTALEGAELVFNLAADAEHALEVPQSICMLNSLINTHLLMAASESPTCRNYFFASSSSVYPVAQAELGGEDPSAKPELHGRKESWAYPAMPYDQSGWEKLFAERMCRQFMLDFGVATYVARIHQVFGPHAPMDHVMHGSPLDICMRIAEAKLNGLEEVEIRGGAEDRHGWTYVDDCILGMSLIVRSGVTEPVNLGSAESVTTRQIVDLVREIAEVDLEPRYLAELVAAPETGPSDNELIKDEVSWQPSTSLREGLEETFQWVYEKLAEDHVPMEDTSEPEEPVANEDDGEEGEALFQVAC